MSKTNPINVLTLEDSANDYEIMRERLLDTGFNLDIDWVMEEKTFVKMLRSKRYDIIIADFKLPGFDAFGALRHAIEVCPDVPFICYSGSIGEETAIELIKQGAVDYVLKDRPERLPYAVERALSEAEQKKSRQMARNEIQRQRNLLKTVLNSSQDLIVLKDRDSVYQSANLAFCQYLGKKYEDIIEKTDFDLFPPKEAERNTQEDAKVMESGQSLIKDRKIIDPKGNRWFLVAKNPVYSNEGVCVGVLGSMRDITDRKENELIIQQNLKEKVVLLQEIHHRVKNNLQIMSSILNLQAAKVDDEQIIDILKESRGRIRSMSIVHEMMYQDQDFTQINIKYYISKLIKSLIRLLGIDIEQITIREHCEDVKIDLNKAIPCGIIINEFISNAMKHAFPDGRKGNIDVGLEKKSDNIHISVRDDGIALPPDFEPSHSNKLGMTIIKDLTQQLGGKLSISKSDRYKVFEIVFAADNVTETA